MHVVEGKQQASEPRRHFGGHVTPQTLEDVSLVKRSMGPRIRKYMQGREGQDMRIIKYESLKGGQHLHIRKYKSSKGGNNRFRAPYSAKEVDVALGFALGMWKNIQESPKGG